MNGKNGHKGMNAERHSLPILYGIIGSVTMVFAGFYLLGFETPYFTNPEFNAPILTDFLIGFVAGIIAIAVIIVLSAVVAGVRKSSDTGGRMNNIPARHISVCVASAFVAIVILTFVLASNEPINIGGRLYTNGFWLRATDMFINTFVILVIIAIGCTLFGMRRMMKR